MTATLSQEWTAEDERTIEHYATRWELRDDILSGITMTTASRICRELNRQRDEVARLWAENERLTSERAAVQRAYDNLWLDFTEAASTIESLRSQLAATREGETPFKPDEERWEIWNSVECVFHGSHREAADWLRQYGPISLGGTPYALVRSTTSRSRESDNG